MHLSFLQLAAFLMMSGSVFASARFTLQDFEAVLANRDVQSVDDVLALLPDAYRENYLVAFESQSLQEADDKAPRIIFASDDAKFIYAVSSRGDHADEIEFIEFKDARFHFSKGQIRNGRFQNVAAAPGECTGCHRTDPRPNWQSYSFWPGFLGSSSRTVERERSVLDYLKTNLKDAPIYRRLPKLEQMVLNGFENRNKEFTAKVNAHNFARVARLIQNTTDYAKWKYFILGSMECDHLNVFIPDRFHSASTPGKSLLDSHTLEGTAFQWGFQSRGIDMQDWPMTYRSEGTDPMFPNPFSTPGRLEWELTDALANSDPELKPYTKELILNSYGTWRGVENCFTLSHISRRALSH